MIAAELKQRLDPILARHQALRRWRGLALCWLGVAVLGVLMLWQHKATGWTSNKAWIFAIIAGALGACVTLWKLRKASFDYHWLVRQLEKKHPELQTSLLAAIEQKPDGSNGEYSFLQKRLFKEIGERCEEQAWGVETEDALSRARVWNSAAFMLAIASVTAVSFLPAAPESTHHASKQSGEIEVTPGDAEVERGSGMVVLARFPGTVPVEATLVITPATGQPQRITLTKNLNDPVFGASLPAVQGDMKYEIEYGKTKTREFAVKVYEHPSLVRADATLKFPEYTGLTERKVEETTRISAVEGTQMEYVFQLNKPVVEAKLRTSKGEELLLTPEGTKSNVWVAKFPLETSKRYKLLLRDTDGRTNKSPSEISLNAIANKAPDMKMITPKGDPRVSPLEEMRFEAQLSDDFGLKAYGLAYSLAGQEPKFVELGTNAPANVKQGFKHLLAMETLTVEPDEVVSYFVWADDFGPDGNLRRNYSDIYFAEVRAFDEIFREGQSNDEEGGGGGSSAEALGNLQKQIVIATWKVQRRETKPAPSGSYQKDIEAIRLSQEEMLKKAEEQSGKMTDPTLSKFIDQAMREMKKAGEHLSRAEEKNSTTPLPQALAAEQGALRALAKLQPREAQVSQSKKKGGGGGGGKQKQLDQLEMRQAEDRYEKEKQASPMQNEQQKEQLQFLNRLRELAQRQDDLNERLKELQTALQEAKTQEQKAELERQLKRLREEERQMLADVDELREKMEQSKNPQEMAEARNQLDQTREDIRRASEEIDKGAVSQALAAGNRAQKDLEQMKEDMRKQTSNEFAETMREMRDEARKLSEKQEELAQQMRNDKQGGRKSLTDSGNKESVTEGLKEQRERYNELVKEMKEVTQSAEFSEPLLSKQLYDTVRKVEQEKTENLLEMTEELFKRGFAPQSQQYEEKARASLDTLRQGVERAAGSVLGDEVEAMRFAERQLRNLSDQLEKEIAKGNPGLAQAGGKRDASSTNRVAVAGNGSSTNRLAGGTNQLAMAGGQGQKKGEGQQPGDNGEPKAQGGKAGEGKQPGGEQAKSGQSGQGGQKGKQGEGKQGEGQQPGEGEGEGQKQMASNQKGKGQGQSEAEGEGGEGSGKGKGKGKGQAQGQGEGQQQGEGQGQGGQKGSNQRGGQQTAGGRNGGPGGGNEGGGNRLDNFFNERGGGMESGPLTGEQFTQWSDRLREVEESIDSPELRAEVARVRDRAREVRVDFKRHSKEPQWDLVQAEISKPMADIRAKLQQEIAKRESKDALVPIDRDPVPGRFSELVRRYYEKLGGED
ncbi:MAG TPA: hypothetical protein VGH19_14805 [Verrucomicrobiae bacterium]